MTFTLRAAKVEDVAAMFHIRTRVRENLLSMAELSALGVTPESVTQMLEGETCAWVALKHDCIAGFSLIDMEDACLFAVFVAPEHEGSGIGRALVAKAEEALLTRHAQIWLETSRGSRADGFYRQLGWIEVGDAGPGDVHLEKRA